MPQQTTPRFADRCAFITGGAAGMGREFGRALAAEGASIVIADIDVEGAKRAAEKFAPDRIRVNAISPGLMASENAMADLPPDLIDHVVQNMQWVHELGAPDDIVRALLFLCSDDARMITGETLKVTGGGYPLNL